MTKKGMPPNTGAWKAFERRVAKWLRTVRTPLSGMMSGHHTSSDTLHPDIYVECKWTKKAAILTLWEDTRKKAKREGKIPFVAMHQRGTKIEFGLLPLDIATEALLLYLERKAGMADDARVSKYIKAREEAP